MKKCVGYIGVKDVYVIEDETETGTPWPVVRVCDPLFDVIDCLERECRGRTFVNAWKKAIKYIEHEGGVVIEYPPEAQ